MTTSEATSHPGKDTPQDKLMRNMRAAALIYPLVQALVRNEPSVDNIYNIPFRVRELYLPDGRLVHASLIEPGDPEKPLDGLPIPGVGECRGKIRISHVGWDMYHFTPRYENESDSGLILLSVDSLAEPSRIVQIGATLAEAALADVIQPLNH